MSTIGLCMIVKNESHVILRCLESARPLVDYVLVEDTGSTDGTQDIVRDWLAQTGLAGEVIEEPWRDFGYNRSHVLAQLRRRGDIDYAMMIDADDYVVLGEEFDVEAFKGNLTADVYFVELRHADSGSGRGIVHRREQLCSNNRTFRFRGVLHEYLEPDPPDEDYLTATVEGWHVATAVEGGARNVGPDKYRRDVETLKRALETETDPFLRSRYTFYLAASLRDADELENALHYYLERAGMGYWDQEIFESLYEAASIMKHVGRPDDEVLDMFDRASSAAPNRAEALYSASAFCRETQRFERGYQYAQQALMIPLPPTGLFVRPWVYEYALLDELAVNAYGIGRYEECAAVCNRLLSEGKLPEGERDRVLRNRDAAVREAVVARRREALSGADQFAALLAAARKKAERGEPDDEVLAAYALATAAAPDRAEALHGAARLCRNRERFEEGYRYAAQGLQIPYPDGTPDAEAWIYDYGLLDELAVTSYWTGQFSECCAACDRLLTEGKLPASERQRIQSNRDIAEEKLWQQSLMPAGDADHELPPPKPGEDDPVEVEISSGVHPYMFNKKVRIYKTIHVIWIGNDDIRPDNCIDTWRYLNPEWKIRIWGNDELRSLRWENRGHMRQQLAQTLSGVANMMRWEILYRYGGFTIDADSICLRPLEDWLFEPEIFACWENEIQRPGLLINAFVYSRPGNPLIRQIIDDIHALPGMLHAPSWQLTGPQRLTDTYREMAYGNLTVYPSHYFLPNHFSGFTYSGDGPVFAEQLWGTTTGVYNSLSSREISELTKRRRVAANRR